MEKCQWNFQAGGQTDGFYPEMRPHFRIQIQGPRQPALPVFGRVVPADQRAPATGAVCREGNQGGGVKTPSYMTTPSRYHAPLYPPVAGPRCSVSPPPVALLPGPLSTEGCAKGGLEGSARDPRPSHSFDLQRRAPGEHMVSHNLTLCPQQQQQQSELAPRFAFVSPPPPRGLGPLLPPGGRVAPPRTDPQSVAATSHSNVCPINFRWYFLCLPW
ncbi:unnamed protein product [Pleuronectes platessa]|uniref:Uncharacterized protein n=1 Tax=Pleuronectes platessa TaxID=8262 RepID=A0A9N7V234_PLEPL|nr:unnamed protein product [Pleuronectes platessa]